MFQTGEGYSAFLPAALTLAQRARAMAAIFALPAALMVRFLPLAGLALFLPALTLAQRAFWAAIMRARPAALILDFFRGATAGEALEPPMYFKSWASSDPIFSTMSAAC